MLKKINKFFGYQKSLTLENINNCAIDAKYAVRGAIPMRAGEINLDIKKNPDKYPFKEIISLNIGNPQIFKPIILDLMRQNLSQFTTANQFDLFTLLEALPKNSIDSAKQIIEQHKEDFDYLRSIKTLSGYYSSKIEHNAPSPVKGYHFIRQHIANFIEQRDGYPSDANNIFMTDGASTGITSVLDILIRKQTDGIMYSIPQYPIYSALVTLLNGTAVNYYLNEEDNWNVDLEDLKQRYDEANNKGIDVRAIVVITPGNPTGSIMSEERIKEIIEFANERDLVILADEVYQENIYAKNKKFASFKKILMSQDDKVSKGTRLVSFHSMSKGIFGECGLRGGYMEFTNFEPEVIDLIHKSNFHNTPNAIGQLSTCYMAQYLSGEIKDFISQTTLEQTQKQYEEAFESLLQRAKLAEQGFKKMEGVTCNPIEGALYAFPQLKFPDKFLQEAQQKNQPADFLYCMELLEKTGCCVVNGSGFGQKEGTHHFRTTILPLPIERFADTFERMTNFHNKFMDRYNQVII